jgi:hypothetical protein
MCRGFLGKIPVLPQNSQDFGLLMGKAEHETGRAAGLAFVPAAVMPRCTECGEDIGHLR